MKHCVGYVRVSTEEQAVSGAGLEAQREAITTECARHGWNLVEVVEDAGWSGKSLERPGIRRVLPMLAGKDRPAEVLMVAKQDRLTRSLADFAQLMAASARERWGIVCLDLDIDTTTPAGEFMANVMASVNQFERRLIGQRTKDALAVKKFQGVRLGRRGGVGDELLGVIVGRRRAGSTLAAIAADLNHREVPTTHGGARWYPSTVRAVVAGWAGRAVV